MITDNTWVIASFQGEKPGATVLVRHILTFACNLCHRYDYKPLESLIDWMIDTVIKKFGFLSENFLSTYSLVKIYVNKWTLIVSILYLYNTKVVLFFILFTSKKYLYSGMDKDDWKIFLLM